MLSHKWDRRGCEDTIICLFDSNKNKLTTKSNFFFFKEKRVVVVLYGPLFLIDKNKNYIINKEGGSYGWHLLGFFSKVVWRPHKVEGRKDELEILKVVNSSWWSTRKLTLVSFFCRLVVYWHINIFQGFWQYKFSNLADRIIGWKKKI